MDAIVNFPPPSSLHQLQSLQGKENFLCRSIPNYAKLAKGFTHLLKKGVPFIWDDISKKSFDALKATLISAPLLHPLNYHHDYLLYLAAPDNTIGMVLVQDGDGGNEYVMYYLS